MSKTNEIQDGYHPKQEDNSAKGRQSRIIHRQKLSTPYSEKIFLCQLAGPSANTRISIRIYGKISHVNHPYCCSVCRQMISILQRSKCILFALDHMQSTDMQSHIITASGPLIARYCRNLPTNRFSPNVNFTIEMSTLICLLLKGNNQF